MRWISLKENKGGGLYIYKAFCPSPRNDVARSLLCLPLGSIWNLTVTKDRRERLAIPSSTNDSMRAISVLETVL